MFYIPDPHSSSWANPQQIFCVANLEQLLTQHLENKNIRLQKMHTKVETLPIETGFSFVQNRFIKFKLSFHSNAHLVIHKINIIVLTWNSNGWCLCHTRQGLVVSRSSNFQ